MMIRFRNPVVLGLLSALSLGGFLLASHFTYRLGFPLDDAWIHQTYARNLGLSGEWSFLPGQPSAGSTAPLWSGLLAVGHALGLGPLGWAYCLGWALLSAIAILGSICFRSLCPLRPRWAIWAGGLLALEWHLVWAAGSGMETLLFSLLVLLVLTWLASGQVNWLLVGLLIGMSAWIRPDGVTLAGPAVLVALLCNTDPQPSLVYPVSGAGGSEGLDDGSGRLLRVVRRVSLLILGIALLLVPYLAFNRLLAGAWWPNTFFAKQAEYAVLREAPLWSRFLVEASLPLVGVGVILLPGFGLFSYLAARRGAWGILAGAAWLGGYLLLYAWRLPVTYQHGRYIIPVMPVFFLWGLAGMAAWFQLEPAGTWKWVLSRAWALAAGLVLLVFWSLGARAYSRDVAIIESEMVAAARWVAENTEPGTLVAAHDIGALGYFGGRQILDLAGLISPEVIPIMRDEPGLENFLHDHRAGYLVSFPGWYPYLVSRASLVYLSQGLFSPLAGGENMAVYRWPSP